MREEAIMSIVAISVIGGVIIAGMLLSMIRAVVRTNLLTALKTRCIAAGMNADEIERVVLVGEKNCFANRQAKAVDEYGYPVEKQAPPVVSSRPYAAAR